MSFIFLVRKQVSTTSEVKVLSGYLGASDVGNNSSSLPTVLYRNKSSRRHDRFEGQVNQTGGAYAILTFHTPDLVPALNQSTPPSPPLIFPPHCTTTHPRHPACFRHTKQRGSSPGYKFMQPSQKLKSVRHKRNLRRRDLQAKVRYHQRYIATASDWWIAPSNTVRLVRSA